MLHATTRNGVPRLGKVGVCRTAKILRSGSVVAACLCLVVCPALAQESRILVCERGLAPEASAASLSQYFGAANVQTGEINLGEGEHERGTVLFARSPQDRIEVLWKDREAQRAPRQVRISGLISGMMSRWRTPLGVTLGMDLGTLERINRRPFRLAGFGWDYGGTVTSWGGGLLESTPAAACAVGVRLAPELHREDAEQHRWYRQVVGERVFSSGHPAMQTLQPQIYEVSLHYR